MFAASHCGWGAKSAAIDAITAELGLTADAVAFVDDDAMERAEVSFRLPDVLVLAPQDVAEAAGWPQFSPPVITDEARRRGDLYRQRQARQEEAEAFGGSRDEFLRHSGTEVTIAAAARPTCQGCMSCRSAPTSSTRPARPCPPKSSLACSAHLRIK